ncbi:signal peptide protein [Cryptosporidium ryanae]|uniref:signal peptide protein n=1 Tax=Cryptosporidium ryanae TaxID=515981 RepID=UPI00351A04D5|nr:signal peptide protein [Cryptosporidium ryanae]
MTRTGLFYAFSAIILLFSTLKRTLLSVEGSLSPGRSGYCDLRANNGDKAPLQLGSIRGSKAAGRNVTKFLKHFFNYSSSKESDKSYLYEVKDGRVANQYLKQIAAKTPYERGIPNSVDVCSSIQLMSFWKFYSYVIETVYFEVFNKHLDLSNVENFNHGNSPILEYNVSTDSFTTSELIDQELYDKLSENNDSQLVKAKTACSADLRNNNTALENCSSPCVKQDEGPSEANPELGESTSGQDRSLSNNTYKETDEFNARCNASLPQKVGDEEKNRKLTPMFEVPVKLYYANNESSGDIPVKNASFKGDQLLHSHSNCSQYLSESEDLSSESSDQPNSTQASNITYLQLGFQKYIID